jgi:virulence factor Mce-like protein
MRRLLVILAVIAAAGAIVIATTGAGPGEGNPRYTVELDNAFGLIEGADVKVSGVRAGKIAAMRLDTKSGKYRALIDIEIAKQGFGDLRTDAFCETRPQSLIGEYFVDCKPGDDPAKLEDGGTIRVQNTASTVPVDLVNNIMRRPYRERFSILLSELGAGLAARGPELNETIRRANPALRETDRVLAILRDQRKVIRDLYEDADTVLKALADDRKEVTRFVLEARDTATASAERADGIRAQFQRFPTFLRELRPTMRLLGEAADRQAPALANLQESAPLLTRFLDDLGPFADASRPAFRTLGDAARTGRRAVRSSKPNIKELRKGVEPLPEAADNLAITLEHLDNPRFAIEKDPRSPRGGQGFSGLEALLRYIHNQSQATNIFDSNGYLLKVSAFLDNVCAPYAGAEDAKRPELDRCAAILGPVRPGINTPDPTKPPAGARAAERTKSKRAARSPARTPSADADLGSLVQSASGGRLPNGRRVPRSVVRALGELLPHLPGAPGDTTLRDRSLLDYLLAP